MNERIDKSREYQEKKSHYMYISCTLKIGNALTHYHLYCCLFGMHVRGEALAKNSSKCIKCAKFIKWANFAVFRFVVFQFYHII